jgi:hypothetical protein
MFCQYGHMTECHYPHDCEAAMCGHYQVQDDFERLDDLFDPGPSCEFCGCDQFHACPGGCSWSDYFAARGRAVCTSCEILAWAMQSTSQAFMLWLDNYLVPAPEAR